MADTNRSWVLSLARDGRFDRSIYPFRNMAENGIMELDTCPVKDSDEAVLWDRLPVSCRPLYQSSRLNSLSRWFYEKKRSDNVEKKDRSRPDVQTLKLEGFFRRGLGGCMNSRVLTRALPVISSHPVAALAADHMDYSLNYCIISNADMERWWVRANPRDSRVVYFVPCGRAVKRLRSFGVPDERIYLTGYPFPRKVLGGPGLEVLKADLGRRLILLDPRNRFWPLHGRNVRFFLSEPPAPEATRHLTLTLSLEGQDELRIKSILAGLAPLLKERSLSVIAGCGSSMTVLTALQGAIADTGTAGLVTILYQERDEDYYEILCDALRETDILWTQATELSFASGLGIPLVIMPPATLAHVYNGRWLQETRGGMNEGDLSKAGTWLMELVNSGALAEAAWGGFLKGRKYGTYKIEEILRTGTMLRDSSPLKR